MNRRSEAGAHSTGQDTDREVPAQIHVRARVAMRERLARLRSGDTAIRLLLDWVAPFSLVAYLGMREGGFDIVVRGEVGVLLWWMLLLALIVGVLPRHPIGRLGWAAIALLAGFAVWTGVAAAWSESAERTALEAGRVATLLGVFVVGVAVFDRRSLPRVLAAVASAVVLIAAVALASRFHPAWFPPDLADALPTERSRLNFPVTYWNGLAALVALALPLLLWLATSAARNWTRSLAVAVVPALILTVFFTLSRGGVAVAALAVVVLFALHPRRLQLVPPAVLAAIGGAGLVLAASQRNELADGLTSSTAVDQGTEMAALTLAVCLVVGVAFGTLRFLARRRRWAIPAVPRRTALIALGSAGVLALVAALALGAPGEATDGWDQFKQPVTPADSADRFTAASGSGRYQWWNSAVDAGASEPLLGIGPGTFEFWWARNDIEGTGFVTEAHSLYLETFAELGVVGLLLIGGFVLVAVGTAVAFCVRARADRTRCAELAAASAALLAFAAAAAADWAWELTVLPTIFFLITAAVIRRRDAQGPDLTAADSTTVPRLGASWPARVGLALLSVAAIVVIGAPMLSTASLRGSQSEVRAGDLAAAMDSAEQAGEWLPFAASPEVQQALILELGGDLDQARASALNATESEPTNWRTWLVLSRIEALLGDPAASTDAYQKARSLNPRSSVFE